MHPLLTVEGVEKRFGAVTAVDGVSFQVERGEIFALLGPNGAGKSTLIRMLVGLTHPDRGTIAYPGVTDAADRFAVEADDGASPRPSAPHLPRHEVGYLPEERGLYQDVEVLRTLVYFGVLRGMSRRDAAAAAGEWLERMSLRDRMHEPLKALSKGNQQKVQFISAVLHRPRFALLDEPFSGLDPLNQDLFLGLIRELRREGMTVVLSAHQMQLVERVADRILVLRDGRTVLHGTLADIRRRWTTGTRLVLRVAGEPAPEFLRRLEPAATAHHRGDGRLELFVRDGAPLGPTLTALAGALEILEIESHPVTLHDVYVDTVTNGRGAGS